MERIPGLNETTITTLRTRLAGEYPDNEKPCPDSALKVDDDVLYLDVFAMRTLWGTDGPDYAFFYAPDLFGDDPANLDAHYVTDRAPADPEETPMPIWPQQAQQHQPRKHDAKEALKHLLSQVPKEKQQYVRALVRERRQELLDDESPK